MTRKLLVTAIGTLLIGTAASAQNPYEKPDDSWISISGTVEAVTRDSFALSYGDGTISVEMDDGDRDADAYKLMKGDKVTVTGLIDDDFYEVASIEANSVYVENIGTYFYASSADEEDRYVTLTTPIMVARTIVQGTVTDVGDTTFSIDTGPREMTVNTATMVYDPLDDTGYQKIETGDLVSVSGTMKEKLLSDRIMEAEQVTTLLKGDS